MPASLTVVKGHAIGENEKLIAAPVWQDTVIAWLTGCFG